MRRVLLASALLLAARAALGEPDVLPLFQRGRTELEVGGGYGVFNSQSYGVALLGASYYLRDGLSAGAAAEAWLGSQPQIYDVSPQVRYVFVDSDWGLKPYVGAFYRRTVYNRELKPLNSAGGRAGVVFPLSDRAYLTGGLAFEHYFDCDTNVYSSCDVTYPEIGLAFSF